MLRLAILLAIVDYGVFFLPPAADRQFVIVYNVGEKPGTHAYKLVLRAFAPDGTLACETTTIVQPWSQRMTMKRVAWFEATYAAKNARVRTGKYLLRTYLTEQVAFGQAAEDQNLANNEYPWEPPHYVPVEFAVRDGASEIRCNAAPTAPPPESLPPGFKP
jgi:hypothetical protein